MTAPFSLNTPALSVIGRRPVSEERRVSLLVLCGLALVIGAMTGVGAVVFRALIAFVHNASYNGTLSFVYNANISEGPSRFGDFVLLSPIIGGLSVVFLVRRFAPEAKGHGVPEVMDAIFYARGKIRGTVAVIKALASAISIGSGAAVGREGPIIQIGSAFGSAFSQFLGISTAQKITLLSAGAGAGIAATFNTPLGGVLFALEILLPEVSNRTFLPVVVATGAATTIGRILIGPDPAFAVPDIQFPMVASFNLQEAIAFVLLGLLCGVAACARTVRHDDGERKSGYRWSPAGAERSQGPARHGIRTIPDPGVQADSGCPNAVGGQQQMLAIGRALMIRPKLLILDEPTLGLAPVVIEQLSEALDKLRRTTPLTLVLGEQNVKFALPHADRVYVLDRGRITWQGSAVNFAREKGVGYL
ncbi:hypothetical protein ACVW1C_005011 [Bradyrhizobium sp. USDA 4011]